MVYATGFNKLALWEKWRSEDSNRFREDKGERAPYFSFPELELVSTGPDRRRPFLDYGIRGCDAGRNNRRIEAGPCNWRGE